MVKTVNDTAECPEGIDVLIWYVKGAIFKVSSGLGLLIIYFKISVK